MHKLFDYISDNVYSHIYLIPLLLSAIFSLRSFGLKWPRPYRVFSVFLIVTFVVEIFAILWKIYLFDDFGEVYKKNNLWIYNFFHLVRYSLFLVFYYKILTSPVRKRLTLYVGTAIILFGLIDFWFIQSPYIMNNYTLILTNVFGVLLAIFYFVQVLRQDKSINLIRTPIVWISIGVIIYFAGTIPYFVFFNQWPENLAKKAWDILSALNIALYTFYLIAFLCPRKYNFRSF